MKIVEQVNSDGDIVYDVDQTLSSLEIRHLLKEIFGSSIFADGKQYLIHGKVGILACNVTYLGNPHPIYKKRIQLKRYYLEYLNKNKKQGIITIYLGIYTYKTTTLFVVFEPGTYEKKKSHNSSAHVFTINLQYAQKTGLYEKIDSYGNHIHIFDKKNFVAYVESLQANNEFVSNPANAVRLVEDYIDTFQRKIPLNWNGIECYKEMISANDNNARQGEWQGFYFEFLFKKFIFENQLKLISWNSEKTDIGVDLDLKINTSDWIYADLKADQINHDILGNSLDTLDNVIKEHNGIVYYICCLYKSEKDSDHGYQVTAYWNRLREHPYKTLDEIVNGYGKKMKYSVTIKKICILKIDGVTYELLKKKPFAQGKNSDGKARRPKLKVTKDLISAISIYEKELNSK